MTQFDFENLASQMGLELIETTSEFSGYPRDLKKAIIGFDSFEEASELAQEHGLSMEVFQKRDGWNLWYRTKKTASEEFHLTAEIFGDDYKVFTAEDEDSFYENEVKDKVATFNSFEDINGFLMEQERIYDSVCALGSNEGVLTKDGRMLREIALHTLNYYHDTFSYAIGVIDHREEE